MNIVAIGAHPDDIELTAGGTLLKASSLPDSAITMVVVSDGRKGIAGAEGPADMVEIRNREARAAADVVGADYVNLGKIDGELADTDELRLQIADILRETNPGVVLAPPPDDYNPDHIAVALAASAACLWAAAPGFRRKRTPLPRTPPLYYCDSLGGLGAQPTVYIDVTDFFDAKLRLLHFHQSQFRLAEAFLGRDLVEIASVTAAYRGLQAGVRYAEGFRPALAWPRVTPGLPLHF